MSWSQRFGQARAQLMVCGLLSWASVGAALVSQYQFDMQPCPWCTLQRLIYLLLGALAFGAAALPHGGPRRIASALAAVMAVLGMGAAAWQHWVAAASASCNLTLADKILANLGLFELSPEVFAPMASCADAAVDLLGVPYALWSLGLYALLGAVCARWALRS